MYLVIITTSGTKSTLRVSDSRRTIDSIQASRALKALYLYICSGVQVIVLVDCRGRVFGMVHVAQDCGGGVCSLAEPATGLRFSEPCIGRAASRVASPAKLKYPRCHGFNRLHTAFGIASPASTTLPNTYSQIDQAYCLLFITKNLMINNFHSIMYIYLKILFTRKKFGLQ